MKNNIIVYFVDQQRFDTINEEITPNLVNLSKNGVSCENTYTCQPVCGPARACIQTGVFPTKNNCYINGIAMGENDQTIAKLLNNNGYDTAYIGKWHLASNTAKIKGYSNFVKQPIPENLRGGYSDYWLASDCLEYTSDYFGGYMFDKNNEKINFQGIRSDCLNEFAIDYLKTKKQSKKPFFLFLSQLEPHQQNTWNNNFQCNPGDDEPFKKYDVPKDLSTYKGNYNRELSHYLALCNRLDMNVKQMTDFLKQNDMWEDLALIYTGDHGCHFRTRNFEYKRSCHDASTKIPMILIGGAVEKFIKDCKQKDLKINGNVYDGMISLIDLPSTILSLAGIEVPNNFAGTNIFDMLLGKNEKDCVFMHLSESQLGRSIRTKKYTYSVRKLFSLGLEASSSSVYYEDRLYDNEKDPSQLENLITNKKYSAIKQDLMAKLSEQMEKNGEMPFKIKKANCFTKLLFKVEKKSRKKT